MAWTVSRAAGIGAILVFVILAAVGSAWFQGRLAGKSACEAKHKAAADAAAEQVRRLERQTADIIAGVDRRLAQRLAKIRIEHTTIHRTIEHEVREVPMYSECRISGRMLEQLNRLRAATDPAIDRQPERAVPPADPDR